jgi:trans-2,3-dihydro-3-hydroxyanthranilate isomerase
MLAIAREFNLSETVFVQPPFDQGSGRARIRIFTPGRELPFAGHPTVGTAVLLSILDGRAGEMVLEEQIGAVHCRVEPASEEAGQAEFTLARLPSRESGENDRDAMAAALGVDSSDIGFDAWPAECWSAGNPFTFVPLQGLDAMSRCRLDLGRFDRVFGTSGAAAAFLFCRESVGTDVDYHARMFAPAFGVMEDPATGSAVAAFAGYLAARRHYPDGEHVIRIEQGLEMGRPSLITLRLNVIGATVKSASIGGSAVIACEGTLLT